MKTQKQKAHVSVLFIYGFRISNELFLFKRII